MPLASLPQFYFPGGAEQLDDEAKQQFVGSVNALFDPQPAGLNLEQFSAVVQEVSSWLPESVVASQAVGLVKQCCLSAQAPVRV